MSFAENFKTARKATNLSQQQIADELGLDRSAIAQYERGICMPNIKNLPKISKILDISIDELLKE